MLNIIWMTCIIINIFLRWIKKLNIRKPKDYYISPKIAWQEQEKIVQTSGTHR